MKEPDIEGVAMTRTLIAGGPTTGVRSATHGGPKSCDGVREDGDQALTGCARAGLLSREIKAPGCRRR
jgi:hypothetical protein